MAIFAIGLQHKALSSLAGVLTPPWVAFGPTGDIDPRMISYVSGDALMPPHLHSEAPYRDHERCQCGGQHHGNRCGGNRA